MAGKFFTTQGDVTIPEPPLAHMLFSTTKFAWLWAIIRLFLGYEWVMASLHKIEDPKWVSTGEALKGFWLSAVNGAARSNMPKPSSVSFTTTISPCGSSRRSKAANMRGKRKKGSRFGVKKAPVTQPFAYEASPKLGICRSTPVRYSRSADGARKRTSTSSASIRAASRRCRSA